MYCDFDVCELFDMYQKIPWKWLEWYLAQKFREIVVTEGKFCEEHFFLILREFES